MLIFGERHPRPILAEYEAITTDDGPIAAASCTRRDPTTPSPTFSRERIKRRLVLGGLINEYERAA